MGMKDNLEEVSRAAVWRLVDKLDELRADPNGQPSQQAGAEVRLAFGDVSSDEVLAAALMELGVMRRRLLVARRACDLLCSAVDANASTDVLDCKVGACDHPEHRPQQA